MSFVQYLYIPPYIVSKGGKHLHRNLKKTSKTRAPYTGNRKPSPRTYVRTSLSGLTETVILYKKLSFNYPVSDRIRARYRPDIKSTYPFLRLCLSLRDMFTIASGLLMLSNPLRWRTRSLLIKFSAASFVII